MWRIGWAPNSIPIYCITNKMQRYTVYLYLETALHVSGGTSNHHQERIQLYLQHMVFITPLLLSAAFVEELEPVWVCCGWRTHLRHLSKFLGLFFHTFSFHRWVLSCGDTRGDAWRRKLERLIQNAQWALKAAVRSWKYKKSPQTTI
jgi:hypothetical protein